MQKGVISLYNIFKYYPNIFSILFVYVKSTKHVSHHYLNIFWILFVYVENAKMCHIHYSKILNVIRIFLESYSYMLNVQNMCHIIIQHFWILSEYIMNFFRISWTCKKVSYHFTTFLNIIRIFSEYYSYMLILQKCVISLYNIFEYHPNIFWILFVYVESAKYVSYHYTTFLNIIRIFSEYYSYMLKVQNNVTFIIQYFWILSVYF